MKLHRHVMIGRERPGLLDDDGTIRDRSSVFDGLVGWSARR